MQSNVNEGVTPTNFSHKLFISSITLLASTSHYAIGMEPPQAQLLALWQAAHRGDASSFHHLLSSVGTVRIRYDYDLTLLHVAALGGNASIVQTILDRGISCNDRSRDLFTPLHFAGSGSVVMILVQAGADPQEAFNVHRQTPLHHARTADVVDALVTAGADINAANDTLDTPLLSLTQRDNLSVLRALVRHNANPKLHNQQGFTPLHHARSAAAVELLISAGAEVEARGAHGWTPLHMAVLSRSLFVIQALRIHKASITTEDNYGRTARTLAETLLEDYTQGPILAALQTPLH